MSLCLHNDLFYALLCVCYIYREYPFFLPSAYTEAYNVCSLAVGPQAGLVVDVKGETAADEDQGRTSEEEDGGGDSNYDRQVQI